MSRRAALPILGAAALLLTPGAPGLPDVPGDPTPPVVTPQITGTLGSAGWYTTNVTVNWSVVDPESIILSTSGCDARTLNADTVGARLTCTAESDGGETSVSKTIKLDKTAPVTAGTPSRAADVNGWYNHELSVSFAGSDATSGLESCSAPQSYGGPSSGAASLSGTCRDQAGNTAATSFAFKYDDSAPQATPQVRPPDANGWYNHALTVTFQGSDDTSGIDACTEVTYGGPDDPSVPLTGTCVDRAGNRSSSSQVTLKYDETAPEASATASRGPDVNGWYNHALSVSFAGADAMSGLESCDAPKTYGGPDAAAASVAGSCRDLAGNVAPRSYALKYDASAPVASATPSRQPNANGWYNAPLSVTFSATDATSGNAACSAAKSYAGPDNGSAALTGTCTDNAGNSAGVSFPLKYDATAPQATATPARAPNANGWYRSSLTVSFAGTDATAGIDSCDAAKTYGGPDAAATSLSGSCRDRAGNQSALSTFAFKYDATAPQAAASASRQPNANGWYNAPLGVSFAGTDALSGLDSCEAAKTYAGPDRSSTDVTGACLDKAGNTGAAALTLKYDATPPSATATPSRAPNANGWYNAALSVSFAGTDATSGIDSCDAAKSFAGPDSSSAAVAGACRDRAGNTAFASMLLKYDATAPQATATASRPPNSDGWYNAPLTIAFSATDATAGVEACDAAKDYSGPDTLGGTVGGSCRDRAGNNAAASLPLKYDGTAPQVTAAPVRGPGANGWYNAPLTVSFSGGDAVSGVGSCDAPKGYGGPDAASATVSGNCRDKAGNVGSGSLTLKYDATSPRTTASASRQPDANGWYRAPVTVDFAGTDDVSGLGSCAAPQTYAGPDTALAVVSGVCTDRAGNGALASLAVQYDATAPEAAAAVRAPDRNGWYRAPLTVGYAGTDATSGVESCTTARDYAGPDTSGTALAGSCTDRAGNGSAPAVFGFRYDATAPSVADAVAARPADRNGWYNRPVAFAVKGADGTSGIESCPAVTYGGPDAVSASVLASCVDVAGNVGSRAFPLSYDATGPDTQALPSREADANGWYRSGLTIGFAAADAVSGVERCDGPQGYDGPDSAAAVIGGVCLDRAGNAGLASMTVRYDATAPIVTGSVAERAPDSAGWYNHPLAVSFQGSDATSGVDVCTRAHYAGPDTTGTTVSGSCVDLAGNVSGTASHPLRYDETPPKLTSITAKAGNGRAEISWSVSPDTAVVELRRAGKLVYRGAETRYTDSGLENGVLYRYTLTGFDEARNSATTGASARPTAPLISPLAGAKVSAPPRLAWTPVAKASYYHVQLWRRGRILSAWPKRPSLHLRRIWTYEGRRQRLVPGRYRWYVWPGYGRPSEKRFGRLLGSSSFVVTR